MNNLEKEVEAKLTQLVKNSGGLCLKWVCPGWSGVPDRIILLPGGRVYFAELKRPNGGRLSPLQKWWGKKLTDLGFVYVTLWSYKDVAAFKAAYLEGRQS